MDFDYVVVPVIILALGMLAIWLSVRRMRLLSAKAHHAWRKVTERIGLSIAVLLAAAVVGSSSFNAIALHRFWAHNPAPGMIVTLMGTERTSTAPEAAHRPLFWRRVRETTRWCGVEFNRYFQRPPAFAHTIARVLVGVMQCRVRVTPTMLPTSCTNS